MEEEIITRTMGYIGWYKEVHVILGKKKIHYHKDGLELTFEEAKKLLNTVPHTKQIVKKDGQPTDKLFLLLFDLPNLVLPKFANL